jgi:hypothetical protein
MMTTKGHSQMKAEVAAALAQLTPGYARFLNGREPFTLQLVLRGEYPGDGMITVVAEKHLIGPAGSMLTAIEGMDELAGGFEAFDPKPKPEWTIRAEPANV